MVLNRYSKCPVFECFLYSNVRYSDPTVLAIKIPNILQYKNTINFNLSADGHRQISETRKRNPDHQGTIQMQSPTVLKCKS